MSIPVVFSQTSGDYRTAGNVTFAAATNWETYNGSSWVAAGAAPTSANGIITIYNGHTAAIGANVTLDQLVVDAGGILETTGSAVLTLNNGTGTDLTVNGTFKRSSSAAISFAASSNMSVGSGGKYSHNVNGGSIPSTTYISWDANSTFEVTGIAGSGSMTNFTGQSFGLFIWNCSSQTATCALDGAFTINGNLTINSTGSGALSFGTYAVTLYGDFILSSGTLTAGSGGELKFSKASGTQNYTQNGTIGGSLKITKNAAGTLLLNTDASWPTTTTISSGVLDFGTTARTLTLATGLTIDFTGSAVEMDGGNAAHRLYFTGGSPTITALSNIVHGTGDIVEFGITGTVNLNQNISFTHLKISGSGTVNLVSSGGPYTITLNGDYTQTAGTFSLNSGVAGLMGILNLASGNFYLNAGTFTASSSVNYGELRFTKSGTQNYTQSGTVTGRGVRVNISSNTTLALNSDVTWTGAVITVAGTFSFGSILRTVNLTNTSDANVLQGSGIIDMQNEAHILNYSSSSMLFNGTLSAGTNSYFKYVYAGAQSVRVLTYCHLYTEGGAGTKTLEGATTLTGNLNVGTGTTLSLGTLGTTYLTANGSAIIDGTLGFGGTAAKTITISGDLSGSGTISMANSLAHNLYLSGVNNAITTLTTSVGGGSTIYYNRNGDQSVFGNANYINIAFLNGGNKTLSGAVSLSSNLTLSSGLIILGSNNLTMSVASGVINGNAPSATNMIVTDGTGQFIKTIGTGDLAALTLPIGDNTGTPEYSPVVLDFSANAVSGTVGINVVNARHPEDVSPTYLTRYWQFTTTGLTTYSYIATYYYSDSDVNGTEGDLKISRYDNSASIWTEYLTSTVNTGANTLTSPALDNSTGTLNNNDYTGKREAEMVYSSCITTQNNITNVAKPANNQEIIGIQIVTGGGPANPVSATSFTFSTNGSTNASGDITNAKLWYTGTSNSFATTTQLGSTYASPNGAFTINSFTQALAYGTNYFWLTYDIPGSATNGNILDAECNSLTVGSARTPTVQAPSGGRPIGTFATLPYYQSFDAAWVNKSGTRDVPDGFWISTYDATDVDTWWRRNDDGASVPWASNSGSFTPYSGNAARFHSYDASSSKKGQLDLYVNLSPAGTKRLYFRYYNGSGTDNLVVKLSQDGGSTFPTTLTPSPIGSPLGVQSVWTTQTVDLSSYSNATSVIRFEATSDFGASDIGIDEVRIMVLSTPSYASLPYNQNFDGTWLDRGPGDCNNIPDANWINTPEMYNNSWRKQNEGSLADWTSPSSGVVSPFEGAGCADFHSYLTTSSGNLDLYVDLSTSGTKQLLFKYKNSSGTDNLQVQLSSNGGSTFPVTLGTLNNMTSWTTVVYDISSYNSATSVIRFKGTGDNGISDIGIDNVRIAVIPAPTYATVPYCQNFDNAWIDRSTYEDVPDNSWVSSPSTGNNSWRRQNRGTTADWGSSGSGLVTPSGSTGAADFHSYLTTGYGTLDLYIDFNAAGTKLLTYTYYNNSGTDQMEILFSTDGGSIFTSKVVRTTQASTCVPSWVTQSVDLGTTTSTTCVIRFKATGDNGLNDIGLDNVCISLLPTPVYATIPFTETFENTWTDRRGIKDIPNTYWISDPMWGNNSWRRQNEGCQADWGSSSSGVVTPDGSSGAADFHSYLTTGTGKLDLYIDLSPAGNKLLTFNYYNYSGTDVLKVYLSTNGGGSFTQKQTLTGLSQLGIETKDCNNHWIKVAVDLGSTTSGTCVIRFEATGDYGLNDIGIDNVDIRIPSSPVYASIPYSQEFESSWTDRYGNKDVPDNSWVNTPYIGENSWRRQDEGCYGDWGSASSGIYTAASGTGYADFHSYLTTGIGYFDLYVDMSTVGYKRLSFDYKNTSGTDQLEVLFSTDGPSKGWTSMLVLGSGYNWQTQYIDFDNTTSATCVIRFKATGDYGLNDIGIDNINLRLVTDIYLMDNNNVQTCSGIFFDSGGSLTNYGNSENYTKTFTPDAGSSIVMQFTSFSTYNSNDHLHIYDTTLAYGPKEITGSPFYGSTSPGSVSASNGAGALTFKFDSDGSNTAAGWKANVTCRPNCSANPPLGEYCSTAVPICNLNGYCGNTATYDAEHSPTDPTDEDNHAGVHGVWDPWTVENNGWLTFVAEATSIVIDVWVEDCRDGKGIQIAVYSTSDCETFVRYGSVWSPAVEVDIMGLTFPGLTIGNTYYMMIDGYAGDLCAYTIGTSSGILIPDAGPDQTITPPQCAQLQGSGGTSYSWSPAGTLNDPNISNPQACPSATTTYTVTVTGGNPSCPASGTDQVTVFVNGALPVTLLYFTAECKENDVLLEWKTVSEDNNDYFTIERSIDGVYWFIVDLVKGAGTSNDLKEYSYTDMMLNNGNVYYRLSQTDYDGNTEYLDVDKVDCKGLQQDDASIISISENEGMGSISLVLYTPDAEKEVVVEVYDYRGQQVLSKKVSTEEGQNTITINEFTVSSGIYLFNVIGSNYKLSEKTIIK
ncbi:MAG: T9SS type A sorting domain-containing protein [Bacteroidota bacterium]